MQFTASRLTSIYHELQWNAMKCNTRYVTQSNEMRWFCHWRTQVIACCHEWISCQWNAWFTADIHKLMRHLANIFSGQFLLCNCKSGRCHITNCTSGQCLLRNWTYAFLTCMHRTAIQEVAQCNSCNIIGTTWGRQDWGWGTLDSYIFWILQKLVVLLK